MRARCYARCVCVSLCDTSGVRTAPRAPYRACLQPDANYGLRHEPLITSPHSRGLIVIHSYKLPYGGRHDAWMYAACSWRRLLASHHLPCSFP